MPALAVVDADNRLLGIVTRRDVFGCLDLPDLDAADVMNGLVATVAIGTPIESAAAVMVDKGVDQLLVVTEDGTILGIVTASDIARRSCGAGYTAAFS